MLLPDVAANNVITQRLLLFFVPLFWQSGWHFLRFFQSCSALRITPPHPRDDSKMLSFLTNYATSADVPTAATQEYNLTLFNQHLLSVTVSQHHYLFNFLFSGT